MLKIFGSGIKNIFEAYNRNKPAKKEEISEGKLKLQDEVFISDTARDIKMTIEALKKVPDIREAKVSELKGRIFSGSYNVNGEMVAESMLKGLGFDKRI